MATTQDIEELSHIRCMLSDSFYANERFDRKAFSSIASFALQHGYLTERQRKYVLGQWDHYTKIKKGNENLESSLRSTFLSLLHRTCALNCYLDHSLRSYFGQIRIISRRVEEGKFIYPSDISALERVVKQYSTRGVNVDDISVGIQNFKNKLPIDLLPP
ncbi:MAG: hypothetical protein QT08_C0008G0044 [archaeon GW2011_AR17]|nr:MAG: hypothetical protein QT08_C0008G0044 [archaeon GW2011_AR17]MBS3153806.1 hypothetical protein [Candidatus Woesearchaeota archaeon]HIH15168.1 hypothetical protein [Nanoarchaeota archaeon]HIH59434.1 hypothetical protein [Nanoarchaeota archaeon]HII13832.1 hypothetical protein [Nanoarchaeota archaeon]